MYIQGQAVAHFVTSTGELLGVSFVEKEQTRTLLTKNLKGENSGQSKSASRPATVAEILAEAAKHGWVMSHSHPVSPKRNFHLMVENGAWIWYTPKGLPTQTSLKEYCEEGLIADRLIKALNLVKP